MQTAEDILNYYISKTRRYERLHFISAMYCYRVHKLVLQNWYREARIVYQLACTFEDFTWLLENKSTVLYRNYRWKPKKFSWSWNYQQRHRVCRKYKRQPHHKKKELSEHEIAKRDWRLKNKLRKDKADKHYGREPKQFVKRLANRKHRSWQNQKIRNNDFDFSDRDYRYACDMWFWD